MQKIEKHNNKSISDDTNKSAVISQRDTNFYKIVSDTTAYFPTNESLTTTNLNISFTGIFADYALQEHMQKIKKENKYV